MSVDSAESLTITIIELADRVVKPVGLKKMVELLEKRDVYVVY